MASFCVENFGTKNIIGIDESSKKNRFNSLVSVPYISKNSR